MKKDMFFDYFGEDCFAAVTENGKLVEFHLDAGSTSEISGNVYKGRVVNVLEGMQAAFVSFGQAKNGYLYAGDIPAAADADKVPAAGDHAESSEEGKATAASGLHVRAGDEVMVQVSKSPIGNKGARLSMCLSFVGKRLIFLPTADFCAVSRKITDEGEREKLLSAAQKLSAGGGGFIMRTNARDAALRDLREEAKYLRGLYEQTRENFEHASVGDLIYRDADVHVRLLRDFDLADVNKIYIGEGGAFTHVEAALLRTRYRSKLVRYTGEREMFEFFGLEEQVLDSIRKRVELENGAYLIFDKTEALTAIDVNTGRFTGDTAALEDTVFATNLLAAREIARQVRLRNIGGIVVVDFIDMVDPAHREAVAAALQEGLAQDRAKCNMSAMTEFGLVQFTRKKFKSDNIAMLTRACPHCKGSGVMLTDDYISFRIKIAIKSCFAQGYENAVVELNAGIFAYILSSRRFSSCVRGEWREKRVYMIPHKTYHEEYFTVRGDNNPVLTLPETARLLY